MTLSSSGVSLFNCISDHIGPGTKLLKFFSLPGFCPLAERLDLFLTNGAMLVVVYYFPQVLSIGVGFPGHDASSCALISTRGCQMSCGMCNGTPPSLLTVIFSVPRLVAKSSEKKLCTLSGILLGSHLRDPSGN